MREGVPRRPAQARAGTIQTAWRQGEVDLSPVSRPSGMSERMSCRRWPQGHGIGSSFPFSDVEAGLKAGLGRYGPADTPAELRIDRHLSYRSYRARDVRLNLPMIDVQTVSGMDG